VVRPARPEVRDLLIERAAGMLSRREAISLRKLVNGTGLSTMAVYTYFDGMPGLLGAVRQEGFIRLAAGLAELATTDDPVSDLAAVCAAYARSARRSPDLYALMFDGSLPLPDEQAADATLGRLVDAIGRCVDARRFAEETDAVILANEIWMFGHGACMLFVTGVTTFEQIEPVVLSGLGRLYAAAGDDAARAGRSLAAGWARGLERSDEPIP